MYKRQDIDIIKSPIPKNELKIKPIIVSSLSLDLWFRNSIMLDASPPEKNAPIENGSPSIYAPATPGTIECERASPIRDQPFNIKNADRNPQTPPTSELTIIAVIM